MLKLISILFLSIFIISCSMNINQSSPMVIYNKTKINNGCNYIITIYGADRFIRLINYDCNCFDVGDTVSIVPNNIILTTERVQ